MPRIDPDLGAVAATVPVYDRGDYVIKVNKASPFGYTREDKDGAGNVIGTTDVTGCHFYLGMVGRLSPTTGKIDKKASEEIAGEEVERLSLYTHTKKVFRMTKQRLMALAGYARDEEDEFNEKFWAPNEFWIEFDTDADGQTHVEAGEGWGLVVGNEFKATLDKSIIEQGPRKGDEQQEFRSLAPWRG